MRKTKRGILRAFRPLLSKIGLVILAAFFTSCATPKGYERAFVNDEEMKPDMRPCQHLEAYFQIIREGASGANGGKTGGGCGCN